MMATAASEREIKLPTTIYGIKNCDTMKKARAWLDGHGVAYAFHDYKTAGITKDKLKRWADELGAMRERIQAMRRRLHDGLVARVPGRDFSCFVTQRGMFSYTGLSEAQVNRLRDEHGVYLVRSGRMCMSGAM